MAEALALPIRRAIPRECVSRAGRTLPAQRHGWVTLAAMALVFGVLLTEFESQLAGLGGERGATAAAAVICVLGAQALPRLRRRVIADPPDPAAL